MSYGLTAYTLNRGMLAQACGEGMELYEEILADDRGRITSLGGQLDVDVDRALRELLSGAGDGDGRAHAYALELVCRRLALPLTNRALYPARLDLLDAIDAALADADHPDGFSLARLALAGPPVPLPARPDFPSIGWIDLACTKAFAERWREAPTEPEDPRLADAIAEVAVWAQTASAEGEGLIGFYY